MSKENEDWLIAAIESYNIDSSLGCEEITAELKKHISSLKEDINQKYRLDVAAKSKGRKKSYDEKMKKRDEIWQEIEKINEIIIIIAGRIEIDPNKSDDNPEESANIIKKREERILQNLAMQERAKKGLNNMLSQLNKNPKDIEETKNMLEKVCIKIEVLRMQLKLFDIKKKREKNIPKEYYLHELKNRLKIEEAMFKGAGKAMEAFSKNIKAKKSINDTIQKSSQKINLLKMAIEKLVSELMTKDNMKIFLHNESIFDSIMPHSVNSKVFPITGTLNIEINKCFGLIDRELLTKAKSSKSTKNQICVLIFVDNKLSHETPLKPMDEEWTDYKTALKVYKAKELQFQILYQSEIMCGIKYLILEDLIDEKTRQIDLDLAPQGVLSLTIGFLNPLIDNPVKLKRNNAIPKRYNLTGPSRLGVDLPIWGEIIRQKSYEERAKKSSLSQETQSSIDDFELLKILGAGNFGQVILCKDKNYGICAMKLQLKKEILSRGEIDTLKVEMNVLRYAAETKNSFLVNLVACFTTELHVCFVMEFAAGGDLMTKIQKNSFTHSQSVFYAGCVLLGLKYLHQLNILYRDLKLDNVMLCSDGYAKITDFGLCKEKIGFQDQTYTFCGTPEFISPEMLTCSFYTRAIDWWQFGVFLYEMVTMQPPFYGDDDEELFNSIIHDKLDLTIIKKESSRDIIRRLLVKAPENRLGNSINDALDIMAHSFFSGIDFKALEAKTIKAPVKPKLSSEVDTSNFEAEFTSRKPEIPSGISDLLEEDNEVFSIFNYSIY